MIAELLPAWVAVVETTTDSGEVSLYPAERDVIAGAVAKRRAEFSTVRTCARAALAELGQPPPPILPGERGAPSWPAGVIGSMTHCAGYRAAAVALATSGLSLGIDAEPCGPLPEGVLDVVARPEERRQLDELAGSPFDRLLFSIKECVYKAWFPLTGKWLDFEQVSVRLYPEESTFHARLLVQGPRVGDVELDAFTGRFRITEDFIATAIAVPFHRHS